MTGGLWRCGCGVYHIPEMRRCVRCGGISPDAAELCARIAEGRTEPLAVGEWAPVPAVAVRLRSERARLLSEEGVG